MKKSIYNTPEMNLIQVKSSRIICTSPFQVNVNPNSEMGSTEVFE